MYDTIMIVIPHDRSQEPTVSGSVEPKNSVIAQKLFLNLAAQLQSSIVAHVFKSGVESVTNAASNTEDVDTMIESMYDPTVEQIEEPVQEQLDNVTE